MKRAVSLILAAFMVLAVLAGCTSAPAAPAAPSTPATSPSSGAPSAPSTPDVKQGEFVMKLATATTNDRQAGSLELLKEYIERESKGRIKVETYPSGQMGSNDQVHQLLMSNAVQGIAEPTAFMSGFCDPLTLCDLPFLFNFDKLSLGDISDALNGAAGDTMRKLVDDMGLYVAGMNVISHRYAMTKFDVKSLADLKGKKIRCGNPVLQQQWAALGAVGVPMTVPELYTALQQGVVDGHESDCNFFNSGKYYEVAPNLLHQPLGIQTSVHLFNKAFIASLPADLQEIVKGASAAVRDAYQQGTWGDVEGFISDKWPKAGVKIMEVSPEMKAEMIEKTKVVHTEFLKNHPDLQASYDALVATNK